MVYSCQTTKKTAASTTVAIQDTITVNNFRKLIKDKELYIAVTEVVPLDTAYIIKDTIHLLTKKIKACESDKFKLLWNGNMVKSLPPQASVKLFQEVDAACTEQHFFHLTYNIKPLRFKSDTILNTSDTAFVKITSVRVGGWRNFLKYEF